jgi:uncharacterized membrane protein YtjA (UPF0391 family)
MDLAHIDMRVHEKHLGNMSSCLTTVKERLQNSPQRAGNVQSPLSQRGEVARKGEEAMLSWAVCFLIIALIAAVLGFGGIAGTAVGIAKLLFFVFLIIFVISLIMGLARGRTRV